MIDSSMQHSPLNFSSIQPHTDAIAVFCDTESSPTCWATEAGTPCGATETSPICWALAHSTPTQAARAAPEQQRAEARLAARAALCGQLAKRWACQPHELAISNERGQAPRLTRWPVHVTQAQRDGLRLSIAHAKAASLVALQLARGGATSNMATAAARPGLASSAPAGPPSNGLGVDLQAITALPASECLALAQLYLSPEDQSALQHMQAAHRRGDALSRHFAQAWALHEARLKAAGIALTEWSPALQMALRPTEARPLRLPDAAWARGHVAALAWHRVG
jgi:phosphopantetheinyl transferase